MNFSQIKNVRPTLLELHSLFSGSRSALHEGELETNGRRKLMELKG